MGVKSKTTKRGSPKRQGKRPVGASRTRRAGQAPKGSSLLGATTHITASDGNVFADLGFSPEEAENLKIRSDLMSELQRLISGMTQTDAAARLGVSQPRVSELVRDQIDRFTIDSLVNMLARGGMRIRVSVDKRRRPAA
jgi:predicted XRE-type DNA-binding protein